MKRCARPPSHPGKSTIIEPAVRHRETTCANSSARAAASRGSGVSLRRRLGKHGTAGRAAATPLSGSLARAAGCPSRRRNAASPTSASVERRGTSWRTHWLHTACWGLLYSSLAARMSCAVRTGHGTSDVGMADHPMHEPTSRMTHDAESASRTHAYPESDSSFSTTALAALSRKYARSSSNTLQGRAALAWTSRPERSRP